MVLGWTDHAGPDAAEYYATIFAIAESPITRGVLWAARIDGLTRDADAGRTWVNVPPPT